MTDLYYLFNQLVNDYGYATAITFLVLFGFGFAIYKLLKNSSESITKYVEEKLKDSSETHKKALAHRKNITPFVRETLSDLAEKTDADRTMLMEYSNGSSNLVGLPFLYITATCEFIRPGIYPDSQNYQRVNTSLFATIIEDMEELGYVYIEDIENVIEKYPVIYGLFKPSCVKSALLYPLYGMDNSIGFIVITGLDNKIINKKLAVPLMSTHAQKISSLINFEGINDND